jgi:hypothetical protein
VTEDEMWDALKAKWWPDDPFPWTEEYGHQHKLTFRTVQVLQPKSIFEIGVRAGYSAFAMLSAAPDAQYLGWDADVGGYGGEIGYLDRARAFLDAEFPGRVTLQRCDSQAVLTLPARFDLAHIDGDHTHEGTLHDINLCAPFCRYLIVDDYDLIPKVKIAVNEWLIDHVKTGLRFTRMSDGGFRGAMLIHTEALHDIS